MEGTKEYVGLMSACAGQKQYIDDLKTIALETRHWVIEEKPDDVNQAIDGWQ